jgi:hypothetical protein
LKLKLMHSGHCRRVAERWRCCQRKSQVLMMLSRKLRTDTAAVESADALEQVKAADVDVARQS